LPVYEYEHTEKTCSLGKTFTLTRSIHDEPIHRCPACNRPIQKLVSVCNISTPKSNSELRDLGFTKLVRRDDGVYENVTARDGESKVMHRDKPETLPDLSKTIRD